MIKNLKEFAKFGLVGILNTLLSLAVYYLFLWLGVYYQLANVIAWAVGVLNSFYWNSRYVFYFRGKWLRALGKSYLVYGSTLIIVTLLLYILVEKFGISPTLAQPLTLTVSVPLNFVLHKFWAYR